MLATAARRIFSARLGPRVAIKSFLDAITDKDLLTAITIIRNNVTVTTLHDAIKEGGGGCGGGGNAGCNKNLKKQVRALVAKSSSFVPYIKADSTAAWQAMSELQRTERINKRQAQGTRVASAVKKAKKGGDIDINSSSKEVNSYTLAALIGDVSRKSSETIPVASETQLEDDTDTTMTDLPTTGASEQLQGQGCLNYSSKTCRKG